MIEKIWDFFEKSFGINAVIVMMIAIFIFYIVTNLPKIMDSITYFQSRKIKHINEALSSEWVDDNSKKILKRDISSLYLSGILKIKVSEKEVEEIVKVSNITDGNFSTIELYHSISRLPWGFYQLPLEDLKNKKNDIEKSQIVDRRVMFFFIVFLPSLTFLFFQDINGVFFWNKYQLIPLVLAIIILVTIVRTLLVSLKEKRNAISVLKYFIFSLEAD